MILKAEILFDVGEDQKDRDNSKAIHQVLAEDLDMIIKDHINYVRVILIEVYKPEIITRRRE